MTLLRLADDVYSAVLSWCTTAELGRMELVRHIPERAWHEHAQRRAGAPWPSSKAGLLAMHCAVHVMHPPVRLRVRCFALGPSNQWACGLDYGYVLNGCVMHGPQVDSLAWHEGKLIVCSKRIGWAYTSTWHRVMPCLCVSGPVRVYGTVHGTAPVCSVPYPCTSIVQSSVRIAAWHESGHVTIFSTTLQVLAVCDTNTTSPKYLSVVGDVVRMAGYTWHDGRCSGTCPCDTRDACGQSYILSCL